MLIPNNHRGIGLLYNQIEHLNGKLNVANLLGSTTIFSILWFELKINLINALFLDTN